MKKHRYTIKTALIGLLFTLIYLFFPLIVSPIHAYKTEAFSLAGPTELLMTKGGDDRLLLDPTNRTNKYYTRTFPCSSMITRSSCTASFPTSQAFHAAQVAHQKLREAALTNNLDHECDTQLKNIRKRITRAFALSHGPPDEQTNEQKKNYTILAPSGTTAEMMVTLLALARSQANKNKQKNKNVSPTLTNKDINVPPVLASNDINSPPVLTIIIAAGEVGTGSALAASFRHFSPLTPYGTHVTLGSYLDGTNDTLVELVQIPVRNQETGLVKMANELENNLENLLVHAITNKDQIVVLHLVQASKTGLCAPDLTFVKRMKKQYGKSLLVVVDAAQVRCEKSILKEYLASDFSVFLTGSKFFSGPPFSGVLLFPENEIAEFKHEALSVPIGLGDYFTAYDIDDRLTPLRKQLPTWKNYGLLLRWQAALHEIENYMLLDVTLRTTLIKQWVEGVKKIIATTPYVQTLESTNNNLCMLDNSMLAGCNTIITITVHPATDDGSKEKPLSEAELKNVHRWLTLDLSEWLPATADDQERTVACQTYLIGQPVKVLSGTNEYGVLRIVIGAPLVSSMASKIINNDQNVKQSVGQELEDDQRMVKKLSLIGKYYHIFKQHNEESKL